MPTAQDLDFGSDPWLNAEKLANFKDWYASARESVELAELDKFPVAVSEYVSYDQGYGDAMKDVLMEIYEKPTMVAAPPVVNEIVEVVEKGGIKRPILIVTAVGLGYLVYKNRRKVKSSLKNTVTYCKDSKDEYNKRGKEGLQQMLIDDVKLLTNLVEQQTEKIDNMPGGRKNPNG